MARWAGLAARQARKVIGEIYEIATREPLPSDTGADYHPLGPNAQNHARTQDRHTVFGHR